MGCVNMLQGAELYPMDVHGAVIREGAPCAWASSQSPVRSTSALTCRSLDRKYSYNLPIILSLP